ncbi:MAG: DUF4065 domain-containing protein [Deltaproteobacteria bacterium]|jgi:uncharacterized phage-associated protein|nr:DUF4065 domain-containing protein [Deltaproteobacteria bacterium]
MTETPESARIINSASPIVNWFVDRNRTDRVALTHLKIQKLLYYAQGWHMVYCDLPLFEDNIHAWKYGPVVETVYQLLKHRGKDEIVTEHIPGFAFANDTYAMEMAP